MKNKPHYNQHDAWVDQWEDDGCDDSHVSIFIFGVVVGLVIAWLT